MRFKQRGKYYVVLRGRSIGVFTSYSDCYTSIKDYTNPVFRKFDSIESSRDYILENKERYNVPTYPPKVKQNFNVSPIKCKYKLFTNWYIEGDKVAIKIFNKNDIRMDIHVKQLFQWDIETKPCNKNEVIFEYKYKRKNPFEIQMEILELVLSLYKDLDMNILTDYLPLCYLVNKDFKLQDEIYKNIKKLMRGRIIRVKYLDI